jgi:hypothetical protein
MPSLTGHEALAFWSLAGDTVARFEDVWSNCATQEEPSKKALTS